LWRLADMSKSTISTFKLFETFPDDRVATYRQRE
jgi:hypothetical protein